MDSRRASLIATKAEAPLGYFNPLTGQVLEVSTDVPPHAAILTRHAGPTEEVDVLHASGDDRWVRTACFSHPDFLHSDVAEGMHIQQGILSVASGSVIGPVPASPSHIWRSDTA